MYKPARMGNGIEMGRSSIGKKFEIEERTKLLIFWA
jgi:hypothetical protein